MNFSISSRCAGYVAVGLVENCEGRGLITVENEWILWLSIATAAGFAVIAPARALFLWPRPSITRAATLLLTAKLINGIALAGLRLGILVLAIQRRNGVTNRRFLVSSVLDLAAAGFVLILSPLEHYKSRRPSILTCSYLFLTFIYDLTRYPSLWTSHDGETDDVALLGLLTATTIVQFTFLLLESAGHRSRVPREDADRSPEETSSIFSLGLYFWLNPLLWRGFHEPLTMQHLFPLDQAISVGTLDARQDSSPFREVAGKSTWHIIAWLAKPTGQSLLLPVLPRLCLLAFTFCQPFFLQRLLDFLSSHNDGGSSSASGFVSVAVFTYAGIAVSTALYWYYQERFQSLLRAFLISAIYRKTADIPHVGDGDPAAITLMGTDVERIYTGIRLVHEVWANAIQIALAAYLLHQQLGLAFVAPLIIVLVCFAGSFILSRRAVRFQGEWMSRVQARIGVTSAVLGRIKDLRVSGMTNPAAGFVQQEREDEIRVGERSRIVIAISASLSQLPQAVAPALAFAFGPHVLDQTRAYTALSYLVLLTAPLLVVLQSIPIIAACLACLRRIKVFVDQPIRVDGRLSELVDGDRGGLEGLEGFTDPSAVIVRNGSFGWTADKLTLRNINLSIPRASVTFIVGPVASGKSTLCRALLGEVPYVQGTVAVKSDKLSYCDQVPFLFNASILENIIGFSAFDSVRYAEVIEATVLAKDLRALPAGDQTIIGTKGVALSGGQRQRVSLARALYHDSEILVLDDVFSGLDGSTQDSMCHAVFGLDGLVRRRGATAILCTHSTQFLSVSDYILVLSAEGQILDQGNTSEIMGSEQRARSAGPRSYTDLAIGTRRAIEGTADRIRRAPTSELITTRRPYSSTLPPKAEPVTPLHTVDIDVYRHWLSTISLPPLALYIVLVAGVGFCANFPTIWVKLWSNDSVSPTPSHPFSWWMSIYALLGAGGIICVFPAGLITLRTAVRLSGTDLHRNAIYTVMHCSLRFLAGTDVGKLLNLFSQDMNIMDTQLPRMVNNMCFCLATAVGQAVVIAVSSPWLAVSYPFFMGLLWVIQRVYLPSSKRLRILDLEAKTPLYTNFLDTLSGLPTIRAFGWFPNQLARNNALLDDSQRPSYLLAMAQQWLMLTMNVLVAVVAVILVVLSTELGSDAGNVGAGLVTLITLGGTLTTIIIAYTGLETSLGAISRLKSFDEETEAEDGTDETVVPSQSWPMGGRLQMCDVDASYGGSRRVLKGLDLVVEAGEKLAICGRTGSGKSSILALLLRLIDPMPTANALSPRPAAILIDGLSLHTVDHTTLRERIISASQDAVFLPDGTSFRANLDPWSAASDAECVSALDQVGLAAMVQAKGGIDAPFRSTELSAGQKQLFSLGRALLRRRVKRRETGVDGGILLLDEITASVDNETEQRVRAVLEREFAAYTVVMVTHRKEMALTCDRVVVLDAGRVVEDGRPGELWGKDGGWFRGLWMGTGDGAS